MGGGGKKTVRVVSAVWHAARHAMGWFQGAKWAFHSLGGTIVTAIKHAQTLFSKVWNNLKPAIDWVKGQISRLWDWYNKHVKPWINEFRKRLQDLYDWYTKRVEPWINRLNRMLDALDAVLLLYQRRVLEALKRISEPLDKLLNRIQRDITRLFNRIEEVASVFSHKLARSIADLRDQILQQTLGRIRQLERQFYDFVDTVNREVFYRLRNAVDGLQRVLHVTVNRVDVAVHRLGRVITQDEKPHPGYVRDIGVLYGDKLFEEYFATHEPEADLSREEDIGERLVQALEQAIREVWGEIEHRVDRAVWAALTAEAMLLASGTRGEAREVFEGILESMDPEERRLVED